MEWHLAAVLFGSFVFFLALNAPIALALGLSSLLTVTAFHLAPLELFPQLMFGTADSFTLLAIPFFVFAGIVLGHTSISRRLIDLADSVVGNIPGGLGIVGVATAVFLAGISGSGPADVAALGLVLIPAMIRSGYDSGFSAALAAVSGGIGIIVPPSIALIIYGVVAEVSIPRLFIAGIVPGLIVALMLAVTIYYISRKRGYGRTGTQRERLPFGVALRRSFWGLLAPVIILGGIYGGIFTPTEAAAVAVIYSVGVDVLIYRAMTPAGLFRAAAEAGVTSAVIMSIVASASLFAWILNTRNIAVGAASAMLGFTSNPWALLLVMNVLLLAAGLFLDAISIFYIFMPVFLPIIRHAGIDPVHFGIIATVNLAIGQVTPPVGVNLVAASGVSGETAGRIARAAVPLIVAELAALVLITIFPGLSLFLPDLLR